MLAGNGSDEVLAFAFRAFCGAGKPVAYADITYGFYKSQAALFGLDVNVILFSVAEEGQLRVRQLHRQFRVVFDLQVQIAQGEPPRCPIRLPAAIHLQPVVCEIPIQGVQRLRPDSVPAGEGDRDRGVGWINREISRDVRGVAQGHRPVLHGEDAALVPSRGRGGGLSTVCPGGEGHHHALCVLPGGHAGGEIPRPVLQAVVRHPDVIAADDAVLRF